MFARANNPNKFSIALKHSQQSETMREHLFITCISYRLAFSIEENKLISCFENWTLHSSVSGCRKCSLLLHHLFFNLNPTFFLSFSLLFLLSSSFLNICSINHKHCVTLGECVFTVTLQKTILPQLVSLHFS